MDLKASIVAQIEAAGGRHDEPEIYDGPPGDPGIGGGPGSISWEINGDLASLIVGGTAAIIMEILHPSVMAGVFTRPELVVDPGLAQLGAMALVMIATVGITFSIQARFTEHRARDIFARIVLAAFALVVLLHPNREIAMLACVPVGLFIAYWVMRRRDVAVPAPSSAS